LGSCKRTERRQRKRERERERERETSFFFFLPSSLTHFFSCQAKEKEQSRTDRAPDRNKKEIVDKTTGDSASVLLLFLLLQYQPLSDSCWLKNITQYKFILTASANKTIVIPICDIGL
jgi:hypothetical protein